MIEELTVIRMTSVRLPFSSSLSVLNLSPTDVLFDYRILKMGSPCLLSTFESSREGGSDALGVAFQF